MVDRKNGLTYADSGSISMREPPGRSHRRWFAPRSRGADAEIGGFGCSTSGRRPGPGAGGATDGVGNSLKIAIETGCMVASASTRGDVGQRPVVQGAEPLFFDYCLRQA
jgi:hypothetical protein